MATEARKNRRYDRFLRRPIASKPMISPNEVFSPFFAGGVWGNRKLNKPNTIDAPAAVLNVRIKFPSCSQFIHPISRPATIHPIVPKTRMAGNSLPGSFICLNDMEFTSASVGI
ncbi:hypothetical protein D9M68_733160 [compost metagenome]